MSTFRKTFIAIALPISLQYLLRSSLNLIDTIMVGQLGDAAIAGVGIGNTIYFLMNIFLLGITSGTGIFVAQFFGKDDKVNLKKITGLGLIVASVITITYTIICFSMPRLLLGLFTEDMKVVSLGGSYLKVVSLSYFITGITAIFSTVTRSTNKARLPLMASIAGISVNTLGNYLLIFGVGMFPKLGVVGAAYATVLARLVEGLILITAVYSKHPLVAVKLKHLTGIPKSMMTRFFKESGVIITKDALWGLGTTLYIAIYARMGTESVASINIMNTIKSLAFILMTGIANAGGVMIGRALGAKKYDQAFFIAKRIQKIALVSAGLSAFIMILIRPYILSLFKISDVVYKNTNSILMVFALFFVFESYSMISVMSILRSGADNKFCMYMDLVAVWLIGLPLAYMGGLVMGYSVTIVYALIMSQEIFKNILLYFRVNSKKWVNNLVDDI